MARRTWCMMLAITAVLVAPSVSHSLDRCQAKVNTKTGAIEVSANNVVGNPVWGPTADASRPFHNEGTCLNSAGKLTKCNLGDPTTDAGRTPPPGCVVYVDDDSGDGVCIAFIKKNCVNLTAVPGSLQQYICGSAGGVEVGGFCWFYSSPDEECSNPFCEDRGLAYDDPGTRTYAGSDGTDANCEAVLTALQSAGKGVPADVNGVDEASSGLGFGCYTEATECPESSPSTGSCWRRDATATAAGANAPGVSRACACR